MGRTMGIHASLTTGNYVEQEFTAEHIKVASNLTQKQNLFVTEYLRHLNPAEAARTAGFKGAGAGTRLLAKPYIARAVELGIERRLQRIEIGQDYVIQKLFNKSNVSMADFATRNAADTGWIFGPDSASYEKLHAIKKVKTKTYTEGKGDNKVVVVETEFELHDSMVPLKLLGEHLGMFNKSKIELSGPNGDPIPLIAIELVPVQRGTFFEAEIIEDKIQVIHQSPT